MSREWYFAKGKTQSGPVTTEVLIEFARSGELKPGDLIWTDGMKQWEPAGRCTPIVNSGDRVGPATAPAATAAVNTAIADTTAEGSAASSPAAPQPATKAAAWHQKRWYRVIMGCAIALIGVAKLCKLLVLIYGTAGAYGPHLEFNHGDLYYTAAVTKAEAQTLGTYLVKEKFFSGRPISVQLAKDNRTYQFRLIVKPEALKDPKYLAIIPQFSAEISKNVFHGERVDIHLCDDAFKTLRSVASQKNAS